MKYYKYIRNLVFTLNEEVAHETSIGALKYNLVPSQQCIDDDILRQKLWNIEFINPIGLAAGYDKNAEAIAALSRQGFGFIETGTVTPKAQEGNKKPRIFRLPEDMAIINRMGFNNKGGQHYVKNLARWKISAKSQNIIIGANIGKNKTSPNNADDYITMLEQVYGLSNYITINISSPNTPNLRELQKRQYLTDLLQPLMQTKVRLKTQTGKDIPLLLKIAPDIDERTQQDIAEIALEQQIDGIIIGNTTISQRDNLINTQHNKEQGGLSGKPLLALSTQVLANMYLLTKGQLPLIAAGGVASGADAYNKIRNGASLVQIYSALIYYGFELIPAINQELIALLKNDRFDNISQAIGSGLDV